jgi:hypothetical protein
MRRPRFKLDGRYGRIESRQPDGKMWWRNDRVMRLWDVWLQAVLAGTAEGKGRMKLVGSDVWHPVEIHPAEAAEILSQRKLGGPATVKRCLRIRIARIERGLPIAGTYQPEEST